MLSLLTKLKGPWRITFDTNPDLCNIKCIMCEEFSEYNKDIIHKNRLMDFNIIKKVVKNTINYGLREIIPSTMGEPLLYPDFERILELVKQYDLKLNLTTNGTFPKYGAKVWAERIFSVTSDIKISINGASKENSEILMKGLNYEDHLQNIMTFIKIRDELRENSENIPTITFQVTFMESNSIELPEILKLAIDLNVDRLKGHHLWITHPELKEENLRRNEDSIKRWNSIVKNLYEIRENYRLRDGKRIKLENVYTLSNLEQDSVVPKDLICPFLGREAWIAWNGTFNACCAPDELRKTFGTLGNVRKDNLIDLWHGSKYNDLISNWGFSNVCKICNMRKSIKEIRD